MNGAGLAAALYQRHDDHLRVTALALPALAADKLGILGIAAASDIGFVRLDDLAFPAERRWVGVGHRLANAVRQEPSRLVGNAERAVQLVRRNAFLARRHEAEGQQPLG